MKRFFAILLTLALMFSLAACGGGDEDKTPSGSNTPPSSSQQQEQKEHKEQQPEQSGTTEKEWPQNKLTDLIPAPTDVTISNLREDDTDTQYIYTVTLKDWTLEAAEAYVEQVKEAGFNLEIDADFSYDSIRKKNRFEADNSEGVVCEITFNPETNGGQIRMMEWKQ